MENEHDKTIKTLEANKPILNAEDKAVLWSRIAKETVAKEAVPSPYSFMVVFKKPFFAPAALALVLMLSTTGLVAASEPTRPGDALFAVKQATESIRLALASDDMKTRLEAEFAAERLLELSSILEESLSEYKQNNATTSLSAEDERRLNEALGITLAHLGKSELSSSTKDSLYTKLASLLEGAPVRIDDDKLRSYENDAHIEIREDKDDKRIEIRDGETKLRIREKDGELRIDYKDDWNEDEEDDDDDDRKDEDNKKHGSDDDRDEYKKPTPSTDLRLETNINFEDDDRSETRQDEEDSDDNSNSDRDDSDQRDEEENNNADERDDSETESDSSDDDEEIKIEVRVEDGQAEVRVDGSRDFEFTTLYTTKAILITTIALKTGLSEALVSSNLDIEYKD